MASIDDVTDLGARVQYTAAAAQTTFDYPFPIFEDTDLVVDIDGTTKTLTTHYTVTSAGNDTGGTIVLVTAATGGEIVTIYRQVDITRTTDFQQNGPWGSSSTNDQLDKLTVIAQDLNAAIKRCLRIPITAEVADDDISLTVANWANKYLTFDSDGKPAPAALSSSTMTQASIGNLIYPRSQAEIDASVTPTNYFYNYGDVRRYGALGDGASDDTTACQQALSSNNYVVFGGGLTYMINPKANYTSTGHPAGLLVGSDTTVEIQSGTTVKAIANNGTNYAIFGVFSVSNVLFHGGGTVQGERDDHTGATGEWGMCIDIRASNNVYIKGLTVKDAWGDGIYVDCHWNSPYTTSTNVHISHTRVENCRRNNISIVSLDTGSVAFCYLYNANGTNPQMGLELEPDPSRGSVRNISVVGNYISANGRAGFRVEGTNGVVDQVVVVGNLFDNNNTTDDATQGQIDVRGTKSARVIIQGNTFVNGNNGKAEIVVESSAIYTIVDGNIFMGLTGQQSGVYGSSTTYLEVRNNLFRNIQQHGVQLVSCTTCQIQNNHIITVGLQTTLTYQGIDLQSCASTLVGGNHITAAGSGNTQQYGVKVGSGCTGTAILGNRLVSAGGTANLSDAGTTTYSMANAGVNPRRNSGAEASVADGGTITHNFASAPTSVRVTCSVSGEFASVTTIGATTFTVAIKKHDGTAGTTQTIYWDADLV